MEYLHEDLTNQIIKCFYIVYNKLYYGFRENIYKNALAIELRKHNLLAETERQISVYYDGCVVGTYYADILVNGLVILELKVADAICDEHLTQLDAYLRATTIEVGLVINFGPEPKVRKRVYTNDRKIWIHHNQ